MGKTAAKLFRARADETILMMQKNAVLAAIIDTSDDAILSKTLDGTITSWNKAAQKMFGFVEAEAVGRHISLIIPQNRLEEEAYIISEISKGNRIIHFETIRKAKNGSLIPISLSISPIKDDDGNIVGASKIARDISDRKLADEKQAILAAIVASSDDAIISKTLEGIITSWNPSAARMFGYVENEAIGRHISIIIPPDRLNEEQDIIGNIARGNKVDHFETIRMTKNGERIPISVTVSPIVDSTGKIIGASKIARDISDLKRAAEKQGVLAAIIDTSDDTILSKTLDGIITSWNKAAARMFGFTEAEAVGRHISLIIPPDRLDEEAYIIGEVMKGNKIDHFQTVRLAKGGRMVAISLSVSPVIDNNGVIIGASKIARDISDIQAVQEEKARLYEQVKMLNDKKDEFIGLASHELKTPLTSILGYLQILSRMVQDERGLQFVDKTVQQVKKLNVLVSDLLDVSKIEAGKLQLSIELFDIRKLILEAIELMSYSNHNYGILLETDLSEMLVKADPNRVEQVIINLLTNAIRYSPGMNKIEILLYRDAGEVRVGVKDYGVGIPYDKLALIFSRFYRLDETNPNVSGLGIGLYLSHEIITRHNGRIWAQSEPGQGSTFWFTLPDN